jgi:phosphate acetyltransferase
VRIGDTLTVTVTVLSTDDEKKRVDLDCLIVNQKGARVMHGTARVLAPTQKVKLPRVHAPMVQLCDPY